MESPLYLFHVRILNVALKSVQYLRKEVALSPLQVESRKSIIHQKPKKWAPAFWRERWDVMIRKRRREGHKKGGTKLQQNAFPGTPLNVNCGRLYSLFCFPVLI
jgi:hypothetical protein